MPPAVIVEVIIVLMLWGARCLAENQGKHIHQFTTALRVLLLQCLIPLVIGRACDQTLI